MQAHGAPPRSQPRGLACWWRLQVVAVENSDPANLVKSLPSDPDATFTTLSFLDNP